MADKLIRVIACDNAAPESQAASSLEKKKVI